MSSKLDDKMAKPIHIGDKFADDDRPQDEYTVVYIGKYDMCCTHEDGLFLFDIETGTCSEIDQEKIISAK